MFGLIENRIANRASVARWALNSSVRAHSSFARLAPRSSLGFPPSAHSGGLAPLALGAVKKESGDGVVTQRPACSRARVEIRVM